MNKRFFVLLIVVLALVIGGCARQTPTPQPEATEATTVAAPTEAPATATAEPPTATPVPPTATPAPPTATATGEAWRLDDVTTWDLKPYERGKEPQPQNTVLLANNGGVLRAFYIGNPEVRDYFINLAKQVMFERFGPGHGKDWIVNYDAFRQKWFIEGSPKDKDASKSRKEYLAKGIYMEIDTFAPGAQTAYFWEAWVVYDSTEQVYSVVTRWVQRPYTVRFYHLADDSLDRANQVADPVESFILWRLDKDGQWRQWRVYADWLHADTPKPAVYDPTP